MRPQHLVGGERVLPVGPGPLVAEADLVGFAVRDFAQRPADAIEIGVPVVAHHPRLGLGSRSRSRGRRAGFRCRPAVPKPGLDRFEPVARVRLFARLDQTDHPSLVELVVVGDEAVGEDHLGIRRAAPVDVLPAAVGLQLVAEIADIASLEGHRHVDVVDELDRLHAPLETVENAFLERLDAGFRRHLDNARSDVIADQLRVRSLVVAHEGIAALLLGVRARVQPVRVLRLAVQDLEADLGRKAGLELLEHRLQTVRLDRRGSSGSP